MKYACLSQDRLGSSEMGHYMNINVYKLTLLKLN